jgi:CubicO group peptidase (beta-lactamase class C family)
MIKPLLVYLTLESHRAGLLDIDAPVEESLPELRAPERELAAITPRHLMSHTAGYRDPGEKHARWSMTWERFAEFFREREQLFAPGTAWSYTHSGHAILARLLERVEGRSIMAQIEENIFAPLSIARSAESRQQNVAPHKFSEHTQRLEPLRLPPERGVLGHSISDIHLTPSEMADLGDFICKAGGLAAEQSRRQMLAQEIAISPVAYGLRSELTPDSYGLGIGMVGGFVTQNASFIGTTVAMRFDTVSQACVVVATNSFQPFMRDRLSFDLVSRLGGRFMAPPQPCRTPFEIKDLHGTYRGLMMGMGEANVSQDGRCEIEGPGGPITYLLRKTASGLLAADGPPSAPGIGVFADRETGAPQLRFAVSAFRRLDA